MTEERLLLTTYHETWVQKKLISENLEEWQGHIPETCQTLFAKGLSIRISPTQFLAKPPGLESVSIPGLRRENPRQRPINQTTAYP